MKKEVILRVIPFPFEDPNGLLAVLVTDEVYGMKDYFLERHTDGTHCIYRADNENDLGHTPTQKIVVHANQFSTGTLLQIAKGELTDEMKVHIEIDISGANGEPTNAPIKYDKDGKVFITKIPTAEEAAALVDAEQ